MRSTNYHEETATHGRPATSAGPGSAPVLVVGLGLLLSCTAATAQSWTNIGRASDSHGTPMTLSGITATNRTIQGLSYIDVYAEASDTSLWVNSRVYAPPAYGGYAYFSGWLNLGGSILSPPSAIGWNSHREVFVLGNDLKLWHQWNDTAWSGWYSLGGPDVGLCSKPSAVSWAPGRIDVFAMGCDHRLWHIAYGGGWSAWEITPGSGMVDSYPTAVSPSSGTLHVVVNDLRGEVWAAHYDYRGWTYSDTGMRASGPPTVSPVWISSGAAAFARGFYAPKMFGPQMLGVDMAHGCCGPTQATTDVNGFGSLHAIEAGSNDAYIFYHDNSKRVTYQRWSIVNWATSAGTAVGTDTFSDSIPFSDGPVPVSASGLIWVFDNKPDGSVWYTSFHP